MNQSYLPKLKTGMGNMARSFLLLCLFYLYRSGALHRKRKVFMATSKKLMSSL